MCLLYPWPRSWGGILFSLCSVHLSVHPFVCPSVCKWNCVHSVSSTIVAGSISYLHILSNNFRRCVTHMKFKFLLMIWIDSMGNHGAVGVFLECTHSSCSSWNLVGVLIMACKICQSIHLASDDHETLELMVLPRASFNVSRDARSWSAVTWEVCPASAWLVTVVIDNVSTWVVPWEQCSAVCVWHIRQRELPQTNCHKTPQAYWGKNFVHHTPVSLRVTLWTLQGSV